MKGKIVSRTLAEAGFTPQEGMQVLWDKAVLLIRKIIDNDTVSVGATTWQLTTVQVSVSKLTTLLVECACGYCNGGEGQGGDIHDSFPLKHSDWQTAIDSGLVNSGKEVEFDIESTIDEDFRDQMLQSGQVVGGRVATLILQQDDVIRNAVDSAWSYLFALGYFTNPTNEGKRVESLLLRAKAEIGLPPIQQDDVDTKTLMQVSKKSLAEDWKDDVEALADDWVEKHGTGYTNRAGFIAGYKAAKSSQQQELKKLSDRFGGVIAKNDELISILNKQQKMYSEEEVKEAIFSYAKWLTGGPPSFKFAKTADEAIDKILKNYSGCNPDLKQNK